MPFPALREYQDAVQNPRSCFSNFELQNSQPQTDKLGLPRPFSGSFAVVFPMKQGNNKWAVRCFSTYHEDQELRYEKISQYLKNNPLPYMVGFEFLKQGIKVKGKWYPILKMEWAAGETLVKYLEKSLNNPNEVRALAEKFLQLVCDLKKHKIAHGDLQHGNILVVNNGFKLVDYDGMYVPGLDGMLSNELGHRNYQHPARCSTDFGPYLDNFSEWLIYISLLALSIDPGLWQRLDAGDEHLLFRRQEIEDPDSSQVWRFLQEIKDSRLQTLAYNLRSIVYCPDLCQIPPLEENISVPTAPPVAGEKEEGKTGLGSDWVLTHIERPVVRIPVPSLAERIIAKAFAIAVPLLFYFSVVEASFKPETSTGIVVLGLPLLLAALKRRFRVSPEVSQRDKLSHNLESLRAERKSIESIVSQLSDDKKKADGERDKKIAEISQKQRSVVQSEKSESAKVDQELRDTVGKINAKKQALVQQEANELRGTLETVQANFLNQELSRYNLSDSNISGIGSELTSRLIASGIRTAAEIADVQIIQRTYGNKISETAYIEVPGRGKVHVEGIGPKKSQQLLSWKKALEGRVRTRMPQSLPQAQVNGIKAKCQAQRQSLEVQEMDAKRKATQGKDAVRLKHSKEQDSLEKQLSAARANFSKQLQDMEGKIASEKKRFSEKAWSVSKAERNLDAYSHISFSKYLRSAFLS